MWKIELRNQIQVFVKLIDLQEHHSPTRSNSPLGMVKQIMRMYALAFHAKKKPRLKTNEVTETA